MPKQICAPPLRFVRRPRLSHPTDPPLLGADGHKNARRRARAPEEDSSIWLTLISELPEGKRHAAIIEALREGPRLDPNQLDSLAAALVEYADDRRADCDEAWVGVLLELFADFGVVLGVEEDVEDADGAERAGAFELLRALRRHKVLCSEPPPPPPLAQGVQVLAVLDEDGEPPPSLTAPYLATRPPARPRCSWLATPTCQPLTARPYRGRGVA